VLELARPPQRRRHRARRQDHDSEEDCRQPNARPVLLARAHGVTEAFQLGGAGDIETTQIPMLNQRNLPLRGYLGGEAVLTGQNARIASLEWRAPLSDIDRHAMVPPVGINRLSAATFFDAGSVWNNGNPRSRYYRSVGIELQGETLLYYRFPLPLRLGVARGLDSPGSTRLYFQVGQVF
jgi:outer membrane protein assembly factor BamA